MDLLRATGQTVQLTLERYLRGPKFEQLQQAIANQELKPPTPNSPSAISLPKYQLSTVRYVRVYSFIVWSCRTESINRGNDKHGKNMVSCQRYNITSNNLPVDLLG